MADDEYRQARADEKAAKARARALRPWYKKKRYVLGVPILAIIIVAALGVALGGSETDEGGGVPSAQVAQGSETESSSGATPQTTVAADTGPRVGTAVRVGDLDFTIVAAGPFDAKQYNQFNEANYGVRFRATNSRGSANSEYNVSPLAFKLVDNSGVALNYETCASCPEALGGGADLVRGGTFEGVVYFNLPAGREVVELRYQPVLSTNRTVIPLR